MGVLSVGVGMVVLFAIGCRANQPDVTALSLPSKGGSSNYDMAAPSAVTPSVSNPDDLSEWFQLLVKRRSF